jgi:N-methylhydantoinase A/oxoprolinase/acetone carboxylase beta subunit
LFEGALVITTWKVEAAAEPPQFASPPPAGAGQAVAKGSRRAYFADGYLETPVYDRYGLSPGAVIAGPALIEERESTVVIGPHDTVKMDEFGNLVAETARAS